MIRTVPHLAIALAAAAILAAPASALTINGTEGGDTLIGTGASDLIRARGGDDAVFARGGDDTVQGDAGKDYLVGDEGADRLYGGIGDDRLDGGADNDRIYPGPGHDTIDANGYDRVHAADGEVDDIACVGGRTQVVADRYDRFLRFYPPSGWLVVPQELSDCGQVAYELLRPRDVRIRITKPGGIVEIPPKPEVEPLPPGPLPKGSLRLAGGALRLPRTDAVLVPSRMLAALR